MNFFQYNSQNWTVFLKYDQRIGLFFREYDAKNWTLYFLSMTQRIEPLNFWIWLTELDLLFKYDAKNCTFFLKKLSKSWKYWTLLGYHSKDWTFFEKYDSQNWTFFEFDSQNWTFFLNMTHRIELFFEYDSQNWTFFQYDWKNWTLIKIWLEELNIFSIELFQYDSKN